MTSTLSIRQGNRQETESMNSKQNSQHYPKAKITSFYTIVPIPGSNLYLILIDGYVVGSVGADTIDEAEEYVLQCYEGLAGPLNYKNRKKCN